MKNLENWRRRLGMASGIFAVTLAIPIAAMADSPVSMAPPVDNGYQVTESNVDGDGGSDTTFLWSEVPTGQEVTISRAVFDRGGYQLYDTVGETIVVPFSGNDLYVMKFAQTSADHSYFVNDNGTPTLFVTQGAYLENATVNGARWYPFTNDFHPAQPVYMGVAPSWNAYLNMGWYSGMYYRGGYWCHEPFISGGIFEPTFGLQIVIGDNHFDGWRPYHDYYYYNPAPYHVGWYNRDRYVWANQPHENHQFWGGHGYRGASRPVGPANRWETSRNGGSWNNNNGSRSTHTWTDRNDGAWNNGRPSQTRTWRGTSPSGGSTRTYSGTSWTNHSGGSTDTHRWNDGGSTPTRTYGGGGSTDTHRWNGGGSTPTRTYGGGGSTETHRWNSGGSTPTRTYGGATSSWDNRERGGSTWSGGNRQSSGGSGGQGRSNRTYDSTRNSSSGSNDRSSGNWGGGGNSRTSGGGGRRDH